MNILLTTRRQRLERRNPIALLDMAPYLRSLGHTVECYYLDQLDAVQSKHDAYDIVGLSVLETFGDEEPVADAVELQTRFRAKIVVGGKWTDSISEAARADLARHGIDICVGPGELYFDPRAIDYDAYPSWEMRDFQTLKVAYPELMSTRGCPYHCHFCHNTERQIHFFNSARTADNIQLLFSLGKGYVEIVDDIFTIKTSHMKSLYTELKKRNVPIEKRTWFFTHVRFLEDDRLEWMKRYDPMKVHIGIESGDDRMLEAMGRPYRAEEALKAIQKLHMAVQNINALFLIGFPGETRESLENTLRLTKALRPFVSNVWVSFYQPVPGTVGYKRALERDKNFRNPMKSIDITYLDPNLSKKLLTRYRYLMMADYSGKRPWVVALENVFMLAAPYPVIAWARSLRKRSLLRYVDEAHKFMQDKF